MSRARLVILDDEGRERLGVGMAMVAKIVLSPLAGDHISEVGSFAYSLAQAGVREVEFSFNGAVCTVKAGNS